MAFDAPDPTLYNSGIDKVSLGAQHSKAWKEYKQHGTLGRDEDKDKEVDVIGSDDDDASLQCASERAPFVMQAGERGFPDLDLSVVTTAALPFSVDNVALADRKTGAEPQKESAPPCVASTSVRA